MQLRVKLGPVLGGGLFIDFISVFMLGVFQQCYANSWKKHSAQFHPETA